MSINDNFNHFFFLSGGGGGVEKLKIPRRVI